MAAAGSEQQQELLALMHQHLVQTGYERAAKALLQQSGRKTFPSSPVSLQDIFAQWKKTYSQVQKQKVDDTKKSIPAKIRVSDPRSSSESSDEEEAANAVKNKTNLPVNNISVAKAETSSEDEDSSSEEEAVAGKVVKTPGTGNKTTDCLQLAAQKTNSFPGKGVAVAAVQAKERQKKAAVSKPLPPSVGRQNKAPSGQQGAALPSLGVQRQTRVQAAAAKKTASSENSSSNSSSSTESEEEKTLATVKLPPPKSDLKKAESSSEDSSDDSDSEEESQAATVQAKPGVPSTQVSSALAKSSPATIALSKASTVKVPPAKVKANQVSTGAGSASKTAEATDSSDTSDSSDSEDEEPSSAAQTKLPGKAGQASASLAKSAASNQTSDRGACASAPMKQTPKPPITSLAKLSTPAKKAGSSESSGSSSESENEAPPVPVSQKAKPGVPSTQVSSTLAKSSPATIAPSKASAVKVPPAKVKANQVGTGAGTAARTAESTDSSDTSDSSDSEDEEPSSAAQRLQGPQAPTGTKPNQDNKPGSLVKAAPSALKAKGAGSDSSSTSDSEDDVAPAALKLPPLSATKANIAGAPKPQPVSTSLQEAQQSEDSSQDSSDESDSKEGTVFTQKPAQVTQKPAPAPAKALAAKGAGATPGKAGGAQLAGKKRARPAKPAAASLRKASESSETGSSVSSQSEVAGKPTNQPPIHPFFKQMVGKGATSSAKSTQANASTSSAISSQRQELGTAATGKVERSPSKKARPSQNQDPIVLLKRLDSVESRSSLDSQEGEEKVKTAVMTTKQIPQPGVPQKQGAIKEAESSSEDSSDDEEPSQSLLAGSSGPSKTPAYTALKNTSSMPLKQSSGKAGASVPSTLAKTSGKPAFAGISSGDSSDSETDVEEIVGTKAEVSTLPSSGKGTVVAKVGKEATVEKKGPGSKVPKASKAKKTTAKAQSNGKAKEAPAVQIRLTSWSKAQPAQVASESKEEAAAQILAAGGQEEAGAAPAVAGKTPKAAKASKSGEKKKVSKKRKLATGDASLGETKGKKLKTQSNPEAVTKKKKKKKKKSKTPGDTKTPKKKEGKEKKADKKKKKSKKMESLSEDGLQKKKKKKKKSGDLEGTA
ncbi:treacle protein isoform X6 [Pogona vitticeps]